jgi:hypothetical protein
VRVTDLEVKINPLVENKREEERKTREEKIKE